MGESADPFRLAIGVFHEHERLDSAISDLFADNFAAPDMCLVGNAPGVRPSAGAVAETGQAQLTGQLQALSPLADDPDVVATAGDLLSTLLSHAKWHGGTNMPRSSRCRSCWRAPPTISGTAPSLCWSARPIRCCSIAARASCSGIPPTPCRRTSSRRDSASNHRAAAFA